MKPAPESRRFSRWRLAAHALIIAAAVAAYPIALLSYDNLGSGLVCEGLGFGCGLERLIDAFAVVSVSLFRSA